MPAVDPDRVVRLGVRGVAFGAGVNDYQVTGTVTEVDSSKIVLEKGAKKEKFEIARDSNNKADTEAKALTVIPQGRPASSVVTITTPLAKTLIASA